MRESSKKNVVLFYISRIIQMLFPLISTMVIVRHVSKVDFGHVIVVQSLAIFCASLVEYGFNYSGARAIGECREDHEKIARIFYRISEAKLILFSLAIVFGIVGAKLAHLPEVYWIGLILLIFSQGNNLLWYFQGIDKVEIGIVSDIIGKLIFLLFILFYKVSSSEFILAMGLSQSILVFALYIYVFHNTPKQNIDFHSSLSYLKEGFGLFMFRIGALIYGGGTVAILGLVMPPAVVAVYGGADRLFRAAASLTAPIGDAFFTNISHALIESPERARRLLLTAVKILSIISLFLFLVGELLADIVVKIVLGQGYESSVPILRILLCAIPFISIGTSIFILYLLPRKQDRYFAVATVASGIWVLGSTYFLVPKFGIVWMAFSIVIAEILICIIGGFSILDSRRRIYARIK